MPSHPYYPPNIALPRYVPNDKSPLILNLVISSCAGAIILGAYHAIRFLQPTITQKERWIGVWFVMTSFCHFGFEGYYVFNHKDIISKQSIWAQLWKEYTLSDSRYLIQDSKVICLETLAMIILGSGSVLAAFWTISRDHRRHIIQAVVSMGHFYSCTLYYATSLVELYVERRPYSRPEPLYFWGYFIGTNSPFIFVPLFIIYLALKDTQEEGERRDIEDIKKRA